jgi:hypothetical protein
MLGRRRFSGVAFLLRAEFRHRFLSLCRFAAIIVCTMNKTPSVENTIVDEARPCTYVVMAHRALTDGEIYSAIRVEVLKRGGKLPGKGETLVITSHVP